MVSGGGCGVGGGVGGRWGGVGSTKNSGHNRMRNGRQ